MKCFSATIVFLIFTIGLSFLAFAQDKLTFEDVMKFEDITQSSISDQGNWLMYTVAPDRGDARVVVQSASGTLKYEVMMASSPTMSTDEAWVAVRTQASLSRRLNDQRNAPKNGMAILSTEDGSVERIDSVARFQFSNNGQWLAYQRLTSPEVEELKSKNKRLGTALHLRNMATQEEMSFEFVSEFAFDSLSSFVAFAVVDTSDTENGLFIVNLDAKEQWELERTQSGLFANLTWAPKTSDLAYTAASYNQDYLRSDAHLKLWDSSRNTVSTLVAPNEVEQEYALRSRNQLVFTHDGDRLFFGLRDRAMVELEMPDMAAKEGNKNTNTAEGTDNNGQLYDVDSIISGRGLDIWHGDDPLIKTQEIVTWNRRKNHLYTSVVHLIRKTKWVQLANKTIPDLRIAHNSEHMLGYNNQPYQQEITWDGSYSDWYLVDVNSGERKSLLTRYGSWPALSPSGQQVVWYADKHWHLHTVATNKTQNLTEALDVPFYNEDHDYPSDVPGYGVVGWTKGDEQVLIYDKFDVWSFATRDGQPINITGGQGRAENRIFRVIDADRSGNPVGNNGELLLSSYHDLRKNFGFYSTDLEDTKVTPLLEEDKKFTFVAKASDSDAILYKREAYDEFPNLWVAKDASFETVQQHTQLHMDLKERWNWGSAELVDWLSTDGTFIQGVVIKPDNYDPNKRYPIMTYYYRFFTNRLHDFNEPKTNHRPVFAQYVSDDYVVFLPDIRFEIGRPGFAATKSVVPGIQKLVELGVADPDKLGLHGHSWSGYQTAFIVTQTDIFDAAISGAPVSNMTSAYGGIRWASGMARSFQYEKTQSRIGKTLMEAPLVYLENSPLFYADKINTPMLIQHGDDDGAVPWYQSIEMYIAMRRYNKDVIFLQYHGEPHHLQRFENKLDYAIRMKEYFDHYLKGEGEPEWIISGEAYQGR
ncbi:MAG: hypothetical protein CL832_10805 [Crocinitomicaceae bacterium]|nr:hypothetical protein [Crocinitomicaceae bacterium]|tara:strand:+ start:3999 stop:6779 length:2781 start_codon:yes stop_codon:yes gene_type:complete